MGGTGDHRPITILLVEDDVGDELMTRSEFELGSIANDLLVARDGIEALDCLRRGGIDLVLLDLLLPRRDGWSVLHDIRADPGLAPLPVIALTASEPEIHDWRRRDLPADGYLAKPIDVERFLAAIQRIEGLYLEAVRRV
jgi:two-component system response regulator